MIWRARERAFCKQLGKMCRIFAFAVTCTITITMHGYYFPPCVCVCVCACGRARLCVMGLWSNLRQSVEHSGQGCPHGSITMAVHHRRRGAPLPGPPPLIQTKVTTVGKNEIYKRENNWPFLVHKYLGPRTPPPPLPLFLYFPGCPLGPRFFLSFFLFP